LRTSFNENKNFSTDRKKRNAKATLTAIHPHLSVHNTSSIDQELKGFWRKIHAIIQPAAKYVPLLSKATERTLLPSKFSSMAATCSLVLRSHKRMVQSEDPEKKIRKEVKYSLIGEIKIVVDDRNCRFRIFSFSTS
jgi:hypothetical protein